MTYLSNFLDFLPFSPYNTVKNFLIKIVLSSLRYKFGVFYFFKIDVSFPSIKETLTRGHV